ncbi:ARM repeat-containing protein [Agrocybe pediades]|nr:ARM repeat-containing protein [Agrocybe pediades]
MESVVPPQIEAELTQILSNLVLGDNEIRSSAEKAVNDRLAHTPELYLLALVQFAVTADTDVMRSFSLVLLRRFLFRSASANNANNQNYGAQDPNRPAPIPSHTRTTLYDHLSHQTLATIERLLLFSLSHETAKTVRKTTIDTIYDVANQGMLRGRPWHALQAQVFSMTHAQGAAERESAYRVFAGCPNLVMDLQLDAVLASVAFLMACDSNQLALSISLLSPMLETLPQLANSLSQPPLGAESSPTTARTSNYHYLSTFLSTLTPLTTSHPIIFAPHLQTLLTFLPNLILPPVDCGPTPTAVRPFPAAAGAGGSGGRRSAFMFPPGGSSSNGGMDNGLDDSDDDTQNVDGEEDDVNAELDLERDERSTLRLSALEFMISLSESRPSMVKKVNGWTDVIVRACLEGMGELEDEDEGWLKEDPPMVSSSAETDAPPALYEQSLDRLACAMGGRAILPPAFQYIPSMMASYDWRVRHAGLMAIAAIGEGTGKVMQKELEKIIELVTPMFSDAHPRDVIQRQFHQQLFAVLIPALEDPEPRVHAHAASALINFCEGVERVALLPYLDPIVERLLKLLNPPPELATARRYVQEQAITTLAMVADASEVTFAKHYPTIMPLLLNVLRNAEGPEYRKLRVKAMECAGLIAIAVGPDVFRQDSQTLVELLVRIQQAPPDPEDTQLGHYLIATWAKVCQAMGAEFETYLPIVMPSILATANAKADLSVYDEEDEIAEEREGFEVIAMDEQTYGVRTSVMDEKCQAFETLVTNAPTWEPRSPPGWEKTRKSNSNKAVPKPDQREAPRSRSRSISLLFISFVYRLIPMLLACGKKSNTLTNQMVSAVFTELIRCIGTEHDSTFLASLYKYFSESVLVIGGPEALPQQFHKDIIEATKRQLHSLADRRKSRAARANSIQVGANITADWDRDEMALVEEMEDFALEDMGKMLMAFDPNHPLLVAGASVRDLGFNTYDSDEEEDDG